MSEGAVNESAMIDHKPCYKSNECQLLSISCFVNPRREDWWLLNRGDPKVTSTHNVVTLHHSVDEVNASIDILLWVVCDSNSVETTPEVSESSMISR